MRVFPGKKHNLHFPADRKGGIATSSNTHLSNSSSCLNKPALPRGSVVARCAPSSSSGADAGPAACRRQAVHAQLASWFAWLVWVWVPFISSKQTCGSCCLRLGVSSSHLDDASLEKVEKESQICWPVF